jgi:hypothetical protein
MKIMKKIYLFLLVITTLTFLEGCESTLDLSPVSSVTDANYWKTPEQFETFITGVHSRLRTHVYTMVRLGEYRADIFGEQSTGSMVYERYHYNTLDAEYPGETGFGGFYTNINQLNLFISKTLPANLLSANDKNYFLGQAYGMRAFYYFHLLRTWGDVVIQKEPSVAFSFDNLSKPASPAAEVMQFIKQDLDSATFHFANDYSFKTKVKWSKAATLMLKSEVYLWSARQMGGGIADAAIAKSALTEIQTGIPALGLLPAFDQVFAYANKQNKEIIFAINHTLNEYAFLGGNFQSYLLRSSYIGNLYDSIGNRKLNLTDDVVITTGGGTYVNIHRRIFRKFPDTDSRKLASIRAAYALVGGQYVIQSGLWVNKFKGTFNLGLRELVDDFPIYRYSDLLLLLAEAKSLLGESPATEINLVRQRAFGANYLASVHGYPNQVIDSNIDEALLQERLFEFISEGKRWYDLRRFGKEYVYKYTNITSDHQLLWPIDKGVLTNNRALVQNPGY